MQLAHCRLDGRNAHEVGRELLYALLQERRPVLLSPTGKPYLEGGPHFSISHTQNHVFCAVSEENIGIDAEEQDRTFSPALITRWCSAAEQSRIRENADFLRLWVLKESYAKFTGRGIGNYLKETDLDPRDSRVQVVDGCFLAIWT